MQGVLGISRTIDRITTMVGKSVIWLIFLAILISATNAVMRKLFNMSSNAWLEAQWYLFGAAFMLGAAYTLKENEHIRIDIFYGSRARRTQHWIDLFGHVFFLMPFVLFSAYTLWPYWISAYQSGQVSTNASGLMIWPARLILFLGFALLSLQGISEIIKKIAVIRGEMEDPHPFHPVQETTESHVEALLDAQGAPAAPQKEARK